MGFPHPTQLGLGGPQLGILPAHACRASNEFMSLWEMSLKIWDEFVEVNVMVAFWTSPRLFLLFTGENMPLYGEDMQLNCLVTLGGVGN
jgi:hypothetical protein